MLADYDQCLSRLLVHEGGFTNDPRDPGGPTNFGITIADARRFWKNNATTADMQSMSLTVAKGIYRPEYWDSLRCSDLPPGVDDSVFDYGVNSGISRSGKVLRRVVGLSDTDWHVTDEVLAAVRKRDPAALINAINDERMRFLRGLSTFDHFGVGWTRRVTEVRAFSLQLAAGKPPAMPVPSPTVQKAGKGHIPAPNTKPIIVGGTSATVAASGLVHWITAHPDATAAIMAAGVGLIAFVVSRMNQSHQAAQTAPTPGLVPVPAK